MEIIEIKVDDFSTEEKIEARLDCYLIKKLPNFTRSRIGKLFKEKLITNQENKILKASHIVKLNEIYYVKIPEDKELTLKPQDIKLDIVFEDDDIIVINKQAGLVVHPAPGNWDNTLVNALLSHCKERLSAIGGVKRPGIVHRLDKDTSGLMVVAKNDQAHLALSKQFEKENRTIKRIYWALTWFKPEKESDLITNYISRHPTQRKKMAICNSDKGKIAISEYKVLKYWNAPEKISLLEFQLQTGRTHQIRLHCQNMGCPIIGDLIYGKKKKIITNLEKIDNFSRQALHAKSLIFRHPKTLEVLNFESSLPSDMKDLITSLNDLLLESQ
jgi:23S rRNA pseudouridine1911/1915/1917 synthase